MKKNNPQKLRTNKDNEEKKSCLYLVSMPIGNAEDITIRAVKILSEADYILVEDTRKARDWFSRSNISFHGELHSSHSYNEDRNLSVFLKIALENAVKIAMISDAGTPSISDPGKKMVNAFRKEGIRILPIPGPSALSTILSLSPFPLSPSVFLGFLSPKSGRRKNQLAKYNSYEGQIVLFESRHRILSLLKDIDNLWGNIELFIGRDMTKEHEDYFYGRIKEAIDRYHTPRGEFSLVLYKKEGPGLSINMEKSNKKSLL